MIITLNGERVETDRPEISVTELLESRGAMKGGGMAVALNDRILPRSKWNSTRLNEGDALVMISAAFGG